MSFVMFISKYMIPFIIFYIVGFAFLMKVNAYKSFIEGVKEGINTVISIMPTLIGLMMAVAIIRSSGALMTFSTWFGKYVEIINLPAPIIPLLMVKMFSSSAATGLLIDIYKEYGTDSRCGLIASVLLSSTETIFYTMSVCFMAAGVKKTRWTLAGALLATLAGTIASIFLVSLIH